MDERLPIGSREYCVYLLLLLFSRGMDFLSTWVATPNLVLEANPVARLLRWRWGAAINVMLSIVFAAWPLPAIIICTTSVLVAARNFQNAWVMRTYGEENYRDWFVERLAETSPGLFLFCLFAQTVLTALIGAALLCFASDQLVPVGVGMGFIAYSVAVALYTLLALWRNRRMARMR